MPRVKVTPQEQTEGLIDPTSSPKKLYGMTKIIKGVTTDENPMIVTGTMFLTDRITKADQAKINERMMERVVKKHERFRKRITKDNKWKEVAVNIEDHVRFSSLAAGETMEEFISRKAIVPFDESRPLWDMEFVEATGREEATAVIVRTHHALGDGLSLILLMYGVCDDPPDDVFDGIPLRPKRRPPCCFKVLYYIWMALTMPFSILYIICMAHDGPNPLKVAPPKKDKDIVWMKPIPLDTIIQMCKKSRCTVNDVVTTLVTGVIRRWFEEIGHPVREDIKVVIPVSLRDVWSSTFTFDNQVSSVFLRLPLRVPTAMGRLKAVKQRMAALKRSPMVWAIYLLTGFAATFLPSWLCKNLHLNNVNKCSLFFSNVPGKTKKVSFMGHEMQGVVGCVPLMGNVGTGITCVSHNGQIFVTVHTDRQLQRPEKLGALMEDEFLRMCHDILGSKLTLTTIPHPMFKSGAMRAPSICKPKLLVISSVDSSKCKSRNALVPATGGNATQSEPHEHHVVVGGSDYFRSEGIQAPVLLVNSSHVSSVSNISLSSASSAGDKPSQALSEDVLMQGEAPALVLTPSVSMHSRRS